MCVLPLMRHRSISVNGLDFGLVTAFVMVGTFLENEEEQDSGIKRGSLGWAYRLQSPFGHKLANSLDRT
jgi:hypothetical protein